MLLWPCVKERTSSTTEQGPNQVLQEYHTCLVEHFVLEKSYYNAPSLTFHQNYKPFMAKILHPSVQMEYLRQSGDVGTQKNLVSLQDNYTQYT